jgi:hypothetical protein
VKKKSIYLILAFAMLFSACSTDLDVTGDWKETMVVYGLLDQGKDTQYIKINKAFLGQGDAMQFAQVKDSVQFVNALTVQLQRIKNGLATGAPILLSPTNMPKNDGAFYSGSQANAIYSFSSLANPIYSDSQYKLTIVNNETGNVVTAQTPLLDTIKLVKPQTVPYYDFYFIQPGQPNWPFLVEWQSAKNGRLYQLNVRFNYREYYDYDSDAIIDDSADKKMDWPFSAATAGTLNGGENMTVSFPGQQFLKEIGYRVTSNPDVYRRKALMVDLLITGGADDLNTFINVNQPSTGLIQERPEFTNVSNGLGIFSARYSRPPMSRKMQATSLDSLSGGQYTCTLKFYNSIGAWTGCN